LRGGAFYQSSPFEFSAPDHFTGKPRFHADIILRSYSIYREIDPTISFLSNGPFLVCPGVSAERASFGGSTEKSHQQQKDCATLAGLNACHLPEIKPVLEKIDDKEAGIRCALFDSGPNAEDRSRALKPRTSANGRYA
jgi:hypothetical protein